MEEKNDQSQRVAPSTSQAGPSNDLRTSDRLLSSTQTTQPSSPKYQAEGFKIDHEEERKGEVDLNALFPGKGYDLNRLFPDEGTKKLLFELKRNKREIERFIKNLDLEEK